MVQGVLLCGLLGFLGKDGVLQLGNVLRTGEQIVQPQGVLFLGGGVVGIAVNRLAVAHEVHDVIAVLGLHNAVVTGLTAFVKAPVVEVGDRLAGIDILIQAAVGLRAGFTSPTPV